MEGIIICLILIVISFNQAFMKSVGEGKREVAIRLPATA